MENKYVKEARYWKYAAWTMPFVALAVLIGEIILGHKQEQAITSMIIIATFVTTSVFWWWWSLNKIVYMIKKSDQVLDDFVEVKKQLQEIKENVVNRQRAEPSID